MRGRILRRLAVLGSAMALLSSCSAIGGGDDGVVTLDFWCWGDVPGDRVDAFNASHSDIQVRRTDAGGGTDSATKLLTASRAGNAPDVSCIEYQTIPAMVVSDVLADIADHTGPLTGEFTEETWQLTSFEGHVYGVPDDIGPMVLLYNRARFEELGLSVPTTWEEFAEVAAQARERDPDTYITTFSPTEFGNFAGLAQQGGATWWTVQDRQWTVGIDDEASMRVAEYWQSLIDEDLVTAEPLLTPEWNNRVNRGEILTWPAGLWSPSVIHGIAEGQAGDWAIAPLPHWEGESDAVALQGGSALSVTKNSDEVEAAVEFVTWMETAPESTDLQIAGGQYPASLSGQEAAGESAPPALTGDQADYWDVAAAAARNTVPHIQWGPNVTTASDAYGDAFSAAIRNRTPLTDALRRTQDEVVDEMKRVGFHVTG
ncbi:ABC transporter substrate-binding protein [Streptomyces litchfieldiae]|uniref:Extracellular solute-binding protein n=1 Tax=Streptomyces litchfieldiae TaxID=3075543 RepID=A0ABU2MWK9_9ACTN|nr:extracellular solute-binding protein [Streptomyces sp. DSM 44938]MDT0346041.1 extracellular solute-binding protein [Streptomyces sp. DSM 44938]